MAEGLTEEKANQFKEAFVIFDKEKTGLVNQQTLGVILRSLGLCPSNADVESMFKEFCPGGEGLDVDGVLKAAAMTIAQPAQTVPVEELRAAFNAFDKDSSGKLSAAEIRNMILNMGERIDEDELDELMLEVDKNGDGTVDYSEFANMVMTPMNYQ